MSGPFDVYTGGSRHQSLAIAKPDGNEISTQENLIYNNFDIGQYNPDALVGKKGIEIYADMMIDEQVKSTLMIKKYSRLSTGWEIVPGEAGDAKSQMLVDYCKTITSRMKGTFYDVLLEVMSALEFGFSVSEKVHDFIDRGDFKGKVGYKKIATRDPKGYGFKTDMHGNLEGITFDSLGVDVDGTALGSVANPYPPEKFVIYSYNKKFSNWFGDSDLRAVYRSWFAKNQIIKYYNIYLERYGSPTTVATIAEDATLDPAVKAKIDTMIKNMSIKGAFRVPEGVEISLLEATRAGHAGYDKAIELHNTMIARGILIPELLGFSGRLAGSQALGEVQFDVFIYVLEKLGSDLQETIVEEQIFKPAIDMNWGDIQEDQYPRFVLNTLKPEDVESRATILKDLAGAGFVDPKEPWVRDYLLLPSDERPEEKEPKQVPVPNPVPKPGDEKKPDEDEDEEKPDAEDVEKKSFVALQSYTLHRQPTQLEEKVKFKQFVKKLEASDNLLRNQLVDIFTRQRDRLLEKVEAKKIIEKKDYEAINKLELWGVGKLKNTLENSMVKAHLDNKLQALEEMQRGDVPVAIVNRFEIEVGQATFQPWTPVPPTQAVNQFNRKVLATIVKPKIGATRLILGNLKEMAYYDSKAFAIAGIERDYILKQAKLAISTGIKQGTANKKIMSELGDIFNKYIPTGQIVDGAVVSPARLETIVRTNTSDAVNQGRKAMMNDPNVKSFVPYMQWSAILDDRTTPYCSDMDGRKFRVNDPSIEEPPAHYNCFPPTTRVTVKHTVGRHVSRRSKMIKNLKEGDQVLTHNGIFRPVTATFSREYRGDLIEIETDSGKIVRATPNHPIFVDGRGWIRADELAEGDCLQQEEKRISIR